MWGVFFVIDVDNSCCALIGWQRKQRYRTVLSRRKGRYRRGLYFVQTFSFFLFVFPLIFFSVFVGMCFMGHQRFEVHTTHCFFLMANRTNLATKKRKGNTPEKKREKQSHASGEVKTKEKNIREVVISEPCRCRV